MGEVINLNKIAETERKLNKNTMDKDSSYADVTQYINNLAIKEIQAIEKELGTPINELKEILIDFYGRGYIQSMLDFVGVPNDEDK